MNKKEGIISMNGKEITVLSIDFIIHQSSHNLFDHAKVKKLELVCREAFVSSVAEYGGTVIELLNHRATASYPDPNEALKSAIRASTIHGKRNSEVTEEQRIDFTISINQGNGTIEKNEIYGQVSIELREMMKMTGRKNKIYLSERIYEVVMGMEGAEYHRVGAVSDGFSDKFNIYEVLWKDSINLEAHESLLTSQFQHRYHLIEGVYEPCFYCGSRKHLLSNCPSKHMPEITQAFDKLGSLSIRQINTLFLESIAKGLDTVRHEWENTGDVPANFFRAYHAFYDIKRIYQLRFFRVIMGYTGNDWNKATKINARENDGGTLQAAFDYLRTGNLVQAESHLRKLYEEDHNQFNVNMTMGYLNIEKGQHASALAYFENAYRNAKMRPGKILALLMMCRINDLYLNSIEAAEEQINLIRRLENDCPDAIYQSIIMRIRYKKDSADIQKLVRLIRNHREYYLIALIDPELIGCQAEINKELHGLFIQAKGNAASVFEETKNCLNRLDSWLGENNENSGNLREIFSHIKELYAADSYLGYLDVIFKAPSISANCETQENKGRNEIKYLLNNLHDQIRELSDYCEKERSSSLVHVIYDLMESMEGFENDLHTSATYKDAKIKLDELAEQIKVIQISVEKLKKRKAIMSLFIGFLIKALLFSVIAISVGFIIFLIMVM